MSLEVSIALRAEQDMTLQYRWYLDHAELNVAEGYLLAVHETIQRIAEWPGLGRRRRFRAPELAQIRSIQVKRVRLPSALLHGKRHSSDRTNHARGTGSAGTLARRS